MQPCPVPIRRALSTALVGLGLLLSAASAQARALVTFESNTGNSFTVTTGSSSQFVGSGTTLSLRDGIHSVTASSSPITIVTGWSANVLEPTRNPTTILVVDGVDMTVMATLEPGLCRRDVPYVDDGVPFLGCSCNVRSYFVQQFCSGSTTSLPGDRVNWTSPPTDFCRGVCCGPSSESPECASPPASLHEPPFNDPPYVCSELACGNCNATDPDDDGDALPNKCDNCPDAPNTATLGTCVFGRVGETCTSDPECDAGSGYLMNGCVLDQFDTDIDNVGDACDNCPDDFNPTQNDGDSDGLGDVCDPCATGGEEDADADGVPDACDQCPGVPDAGRDDDEDGVDDGCDICPEFANPLQRDQDGDGIGDACAFVLRGLEVVQVIQDFHNSAPLIEGKDTFARAWVGLLEGGTSPLPFKGRLRGFRGGAELPGSPLPTDTMGGAALAKPVVKRTRDEDSLLFQLPESWASGDVTLEVEPIDTDLECAEPAGLTTADCRADVSFVAGPRPRIKLISVDFLHPTLSAPGPEDWQLSLEQGAIFDLIPAEEVELELGTLAVYYDDTIPVDDSGDLGPIRGRLEFLRGIEGCDSPSCTTIYAGFVNSPIDGGGVARLPGDSYVIDYVGDADLNLYTAVHELSHTLGRPHAVNAATFGFEGVGAAKVKVSACGAKAALTAPDFPYVNLSPALTYYTDKSTASEDWFIGFSRVDREGVHPAYHFEIMDLCRGLDGREFRWISDVTYLALLDAMNARFGPGAAGASSGATASSAATGSDVIWVRGEVDPDAGTGAIDELLRMPGAPVPGLPSAGDYELILAAGDGTELARIPFVAQTSVTESALIRDYGFGFAAPTGLAEIRLERDGVVLDRRTASASAPTAAVVFPNGGERLSGTAATLRWSANDDDGDPLQTLVQFSRDGGTTWKTLGMGLPGTELTVPLRSLGGTTNGLLRVVVSDGFLSAMDDSDATFIVDDQPPFVLIRSPADGDAFAADQRIVFQAAALDPEQGQVDPASIAWSSDRDGDLGAGSPLEFAASDLTPGAHVVTAAATDDTGLEDTATIGITIHVDHPDSDADGVPDGPDNCRDDGNADQLDADGDGRGDVCDVAGDVDGDGDVDEDDRDRFNASFGLSEGDLGFEPAADLDEDGTVTFVDYQLWLQDYEDAQAVGGGSAQTTGCGLTGFEFVVLVAGARAWVGRRRRKRTGR